MRSSVLIAAATSLSTASAALQGFNYGSTKTDGSFMFEQDFKEKFSTAQSLVGTSGFTSARLYTMIQGGSSTNEPTQAIQAAIDTDTSLLLGLWASGGQGGIEAEISALKSAIGKYGSEFTKRVVGISVGSEDLYRVSPTGIAAKSGYGADPDTLVSYIKQVRDAISGTGLSGAKIGHVDTWTAWVNGSNSAVASAVDWVGFDAYPYFQNTMDNGIENGKALFNEALDATKGAVGGKEVWITESGWPVSGPTENKAIPSTENAKAYWDAVACPLLGNVNTYWFTLQDSDPTVPAPSFGIVGSKLSTTPLFDLSCKAVSSSSASKSSTATKSGSATATGSSSASTSTGSSGSDSVSSAASSLSTAAAGTDVATGGSGLSPTQGAGSGGSGSSGSAAGSSSSAGSGTAPSGNSTIVAPSTPSPTSSSVVTPNSAAIRSGSVIAAFAAILAAVVAL